jgi:hypothetical protein
MQGIIVLKFKIKQYQKMKIKSICLALFCAVTVSVYNIHVCYNMEKNASDVLLNAVEAVANGESSMHGRPLLQSSSGAYKCANCSGNDCGAVC